jgi:hypothetical protein
VRDDLLRDARHLNGLHVVTIAWSDAAAGSIIDFSFVPFATEGRPAAACEKLVLDGLQTWWDGIRTHPWGQLDDREGTDWVPDLTLIGSGWKDKQWGVEPVYILADQAGFRGILPCKGRSPWQQRNASQIDEPDLATVRTVHLRPPERPVRETTPRQQLQAILPGRRRFRPRPRAGADAQQPRVSPRPSKRQTSRAIPVRPVSSRSPPRFHPRS